MRRSRAYGAMALLAGGAVALSGCGSSGSGGGSGAAVAELDARQIARVAVDNLAVLCPATAW